MTDTSRILVVEDNPYHQQAAKIQLPGCVIASDFSEAAEMLKESWEDKSKTSRYDAVLTDLFFPFGSNNVVINKSLCYKPEPLGYTVAFMAATRDPAVPLIRIVTDCNHHDNPVSNSFDFIKGRAYDSIQLGTSDFRMFDERDLPFVLLSSTGDLTEPIDSYSKADDLIESGDFRKVKNWSAALEGVLRKR